MTRYKAEALRNPTANLLLLQRVKGLLYSGLSVLFQANIADDVVNECLPNVCTAQHKLHSILRCLRGSSSHVLAATELVNSESPGPIFAKFSNSVDIVDVDWTMKLIRVNSRKWNRPQSGTVKLCRAAADITTAHSADC